MTPIELPDLLIQNRTPVGRVVHLVEPSYQVEPKVGADVRVSMRTVMPSQPLPNGDRVIIGPRFNWPRPSEAVGVLIERTDGSLRWHSHQKLDLLTGVSMADLSMRAQRSWTGAPHIVHERRLPDGTVQQAGLRPPQVGALYSIGAHWSLDSSPATVVMPTGTGKTEVILSCLVGFMRRAALIVVPGLALRAQTFRKLLTLGHLRAMGVVQANAINPVVGLLEHVPKDPGDLDGYSDCNVVLATMDVAHGALQSVAAARFAEMFDYLVIDEAHHVAATTWKGVREAFTKKRVLQFTATPYRRDRKLVEGKEIFNYPLGRAQDDLYFKPITFIGISEFDQAAGDKLVAETGIKHLRADLGKGFDHVLMARFASVARANDLLATYVSLASDLNPVVVHTGKSRAEQDEALRALRSGGSRVVLCVNMLGEGFDFPNLKVAAIHDLHLSLAILLQFTGRFTRILSDKVGEATVVANIAHPDIPQALDELYSQDSDWNLLLREQSSQAVHRRQRLLEFFEHAKPLPGLVDSPSSVRINPHWLRPALSTTAFNASKFEPYGFVNGIGPESVMAGWLNTKTKTLILVTAHDDGVKWTKARGVIDRTWDLIVAYFDDTMNLLHIHSSASTPTIEFAKAISADTAQIITGEEVFRSLGNITRLMLQNLGVKKLGRRDISFSSFTGEDLVPGLDQVQTVGATKSVIRGQGYEGGERVGVGCSAKGKVWAAGGRGSIPEFMDWARTIGAKLLDPTIDTRQIVQNIMVPRRVPDFPTGPVLAMLWPDDLTMRAEVNVEIGPSGSVLPMFAYSIELAALSATEVRWEVTDGAQACEFVMSLDPSSGHSVKQRSGKTLMIHLGKGVQRLDDYFGRHAPRVLYMDGSELEGAFWAECKGWSPMPLPSGQLTSWNWAGVDIKLESIWHGGVQRAGTIQGHTAQQMTTSGFDVVFDDDDSGEAADLVCIKGTSSSVLVELVHCKFTTRGKAGARVSDLDVVCQQAVRSAYWAHAGSFHRLCDHLRERESSRRGPRPTRFVAGDLALLTRLERAARSTFIDFKIRIVQPGLSLAKASAAQQSTLAAANSFLLQTTRSGGLHLVASP